MNFITKNCQIFIDIDEIEDLMVIFAFPNWLIIGFIGIIVYGLSLRNTDLTTVSYGTTSAFGLFSIIGMADFVLKINANEIQAMITSNAQPILFFFLVLFSFVLVLPQQQLRKKALSRNNFDGFDWGYVFGFVVSEFLIRNLMTNYGVFESFWLFIVFLWYSLCVFYFVMQSETNSKFLLFSAVLKLIFEVCLIGGIGNSFPSNETLSALTALCVLASTLVLMHYLKSKQEME